MLQHLSLDRELLLTSPVKSDILNSTASRAEILVSKSFWKKIAHNQLETFINFCFISKFCIFLFIVISLIAEGLCGVWHSRARRGRV